MFKSLGINLQSFTNNSEILEKGKKMPIGTISNGYKKIAEGKWQKVSSKGLTKKEHENKIKAGKDLANAYANENSESAYKKVKMGIEFAAEHEATLLHHDDLDDNEYDDDHVNNSGKKSEKDQRLNLIEKLIKRGFSPEEAKKKVDGESKPQNSPELGKTKSGKTIYEDGSELEGDDDWDYTDHITAAAHHQSKMIDAKKNGDNQKFAEHGRYKLSHDAKANSKRNSLNKGIINLSQEELIKSHISNQFEKGKKVPIGTVSNGYTKIAEGKWRKISKPHGLVGKEDVQKYFQNHGKHLDTNTKSLVHRDEYETTVSKNQFGNLFMNIKHKEKDYNSYSGKVDEKSELYQKYKHLLDKKD